MLDRSLVLALSGLALAAPGRGGELVNIAYTADITTEPALDGEAARLVDGALRGTAFAVGTEGHGAVTFTWPAPREVSGVRLVQASEIYAMSAYTVEADRVGDGAFEPLGTAANVPQNEWSEVRFAAVAVRALRVRCAAGESNGRRAHPCFAEIQILGTPQPGDEALARAMGIAIASIATPVPARQRTPLVDGGQPPAILIGPDSPYAAAATRLAEELSRRLGATVTTVTSLTGAEPGRRTIIALGNLLDNELLARLYFNRYTYEDSLLPGPGGYTVHPVYDPYPWGGGHDVIVLGVSQPDAIGAAIDRFLGLLEGQGAATFLPFCWVVEPGPKLSDQARQAILDAKPAPSFTAFRENAEKCLETGEQAYARQAVAALEVMVGIYEDHPDRPVPWPEETTSGAIFAVWDAFEECPLIPAERRGAYVNAFLKLARSLKSRVSGYGGLADDPLVTWNHTTFPLLGLYYAGRYFDRYYQLTDATEWLGQARPCFTAQARSWKPQEDADSYLVLTMAHAIDFSLAEWDLSFFESGNIKRYADYVVGICDDRLWPAGFGDSGYSSSATLVRAALPIAFWWTRDPGHLWLLDRSVGSNWPNPYWPDVKPERPDRYTGLNVFPLDKQLYRYTQLKPYYNEPLEPSDIPAEVAFDKVSFRESWEGGSQYLLLDGFGRGKHLHYDTNAIVEFVQNGERWLLDHDYLTRNTTEHAMLSVLHNGRADRLVPSMAGLSQATDLPAMAATSSYVDNYNGLDWRRHIVWRKGAWFLVVDDVTARAAGDYDLELTWKTIDRGSQAMRNPRDFVAAGAAGMESNALLTVDDADASGGKAVVFGEATSRLVFRVELPAGEYPLGVVAYGVDGSSDSLWIEVDGGERQAFMVPQGKYGLSSTKFDLSEATPKIRADDRGTHVIRVTLREYPPVRVDRFIFQRPDGQPLVVEAESAEPPRPEDLAKTPPAALHIDSAVDVTTRVTNHVRQGITVPVSILHQRRSAELAAGGIERFASLLYAVDATHASEYAVDQVADNVFKVTGREAELAGSGPGTMGSVRIDAAAWLLTSDAISAGGVGELHLGDAGLKLEPTADLELRLADGHLEVRCAEPVTLTLTGWTFADGRAGPRPVPAGRHELVLAGVRPDAAAEVLRPATASPAASPTAATPPTTAAKPAWEAALVTGAPVTVLRLAEVEGKPTLLAAAGPQAFGLDTDGRRLWSFAAGGLVRDVSPTRLADGPTLLVSSADTWLHLLAPDGTERRKVQPTSVYFSNDYGARPWPLYQSRGVDMDGDGVADQIVTTLGSMEMVCLDPALERKWGYYLIGHGCMDIDVRDVDGDGQPEIVAADKYGSLHCIRADGKRVWQSYSSIGDVQFGLGDLDGDGKLEAVFGSSTGDLLAIDDDGKELWRFDNFGFPVEHLRCADLTGDGKPEVLLASGTGFLYCLDASGKEVWRRRLGFDVADVKVVGSGPTATLVAAADAQVHWLDAKGEELAKADVGSTVRSMAAWEAEGKVWAVVGTDDGTVVAHTGPAK